MSDPRNREIVSYSSSFSFRVVRDVRAGEAKLCEGVRETIFLSLGLGTWNCKFPSGSAPFFEQLLCTGVGVLSTFGRFY